MLVPHSVPLLSCARSDLFALKVLEKWIEEAGWGSHGAHILATHSIRDIQSMKTSQLQALIR